MTNDMTNDMADMSCNEFVELVTEFLDGALDDEDQARFADHLSLCDGCTAYLDQIRETARALADLPAGHPLPDQARDRLLAAFRDRSS